MGWSKALKRILGSGLCDIAALLASSLDWCPQ